jgi:hypothetical protein
MAQEKKHTARTVKASTGPVSPTAVGLKRVDPPVARDVVSAERVEPDAPEAEAIGVEFAPVVNAVDAADPDMHIEVLDDGTRIIRTGGGVTVESPSPSDKAR